jgi:hypothetical protein
MAAKKDGAEGLIEEASEPTASVGPAAQAVAKMARPRNAVLKTVTSDVVAEYLAGRWPELNGASGAELRALLLEELLSRCPGFSTREYRVALTVRLVTRGVIQKVRHALAGSRLDGR